MFQIRFSTFSCSTFATNTIDVCAAPTLQRRPGAATGCVLFVLLSASGILIAGCGRADTYRPVYYPDRSELSVCSRGPAFDNLTQARQWAQDQHRQRGDLNWTYEVGKNCRPFENSDIEVCEESLR